MRLRRGLFQLCGILVGVCVGWSHMLIGWRAVFVARSHEPLAVWVALYLGPLLTLPAVLIGVFSRGIGGSLLMLGGTISFLAVCFSPQSTLQGIINFAFKFSGPMLLL